MRLAFAGFRHDHILSLYKLASEHPDVEIVAASEPDAATRDRLARQGLVRFTHTDHEAMLSGVECDAVAVGDCFARRGAIAIAALERGRHVLSDKPLCTGLEELERIARLARAGRRSVGCQLDLRSHAAYRTMRRLLREGVIGEVHTVAFTGQHPLLLDRRPAWYFQEGLHGGTINDIAIHGIDALGWLTGRRVVEVTAAREWNARLPQFPHFRDCGQFLLRLDNDGGVLGDVSYLAPDGCGYKAPQYWRITCHGEHGAMETSLAEGAVLLARNQDSAFQRVPLDPERPAAYLHAFLAESAGRSEGLDLTTEEVLASTRTTLLIQRAADRKELPAAIVPERM